MAHLMKPTQALNAFEVVFRAVFLSAVYPTADRAIGSVGSADGSGNIGDAEGDKIPIEMQPTTCFAGLVLLPLSWASRFRLFCSAARTSCRYRQLPEN